MRRLDSANSRDACSDRWQASGARSPRLLLLGMVLGSSQLVGAQAAEFTWPDESMGQRTSERVSAGKRAAKYIACRVCEERVYSLFPPGVSEVELVGQSMDEDVPEKLGDVKALCDMKSLAKLFRSRRLEVVPNPDGSAAFENRGAGKAPFYEEINTSELAFCWRSFAVQHACMETFRRDGDVVLKGLEKAYRKIESDNKDESPSAEDLQRELMSASRKACHQTKMCKAAAKLADRKEL